jgi:hypothetical protein
LQSTYAHAKLLLQTIVKAKDFESLFPPTNDPNAQEVSSHTIFDVQRYLKDAQVSYESRVGQTNDPSQAVAPTTTASSMTNPTTSLSKANAKARLWLTEISETLVYYGNIFDVMVQHHPEYVSLAWGTFKLLFVVSIPHLLPNSLLTPHQRQSLTTPKPPRKSANPSPRSPSSSRNTRST